MKDPNLKDLAQSKNPVIAGKPTTTAKAEAVRKTFSFSQSHLDHINTVALELTNEQGRPVNASEALRAIIDQHKAKP